MAAAQGAKPVVVTKKPRTSRKTIVAEDAAPVAVSKASVPNSDQVAGMIATAAYYLAAERNFTPGHELDDWLVAERRIHSTLFG